MNSEQVLEYLAKKGQSEEVKEPITPETKETPAEAPAEEVEDKVVEEDNKGVEQKQVEDKADDKAEEPKAEVKEDKEPEKEVKEDAPKVSKRDYAFERLKKKSREQHERDMARIKELEAEVAKGKDLRAEHFIDKDGKPDPNSYVDWKFKERDMQQEIEEIRRADRERQLQEDIEEDRRRVENCFTDEKERKEYEDLISTNGKAFYDAVSDADPNGVVFGYLSTMPEYPVVLRELMTDSKLLGYAFRSTDPDALKRNIAAIADQIIDKRHNSNSTPKAVEPKVEPKQETKKELPVIGKQINSTPGTANVVRDRNYWNRYLREHPRG
jgi:hypothetical protein